MYACFPSSPDGQSRAMRTYKTYKKKIKHKEQHIACHISSNEEEQPRKKPAYENYITRHFFSWKRSLIAEVVEISVHPALLAIS